MTFSRWRVTDRRRIQEGGERALCYREDEEESRVSEGFCGFNRSREIWLGDLRGCDNLLEGLELVTFNLLRGEATRDEEDRETFGSRSGFGLMVIIRRCLRFLGWKRGDRGGSGRKGHLLLITYSWMTRALQTFTILFSKDTSRREQVWWSNSFTWMFWTLWEPRPKKWCHMVFWYLDAAQDRVVRSRRKVSISSTGLFKPVADKRLGVGEGLELLFHGDTDM
ncbi:PREDICTED: uncharacterized protein LOC106343604 isoform X1 [Brassica oleracea var. oleracea]|uniref:Uncharacterized protein n=1 Tax=Brassica oleracea var. oleracea TaxID=109376 RepID=A0A0D3C8N0_BRAOL|nr:PREDICTED: uncharacterized protein LOC106343604 isoform X1 [Brassica oleracea var. oleracea]